MMVQFSSKALDDLERLRSFIAENNPKAANKIARTLVEKIEHLADQPHMGTVVPGSPVQAMRDLHTGRYTVRYLAGKAEVIILRIWHNKENH